MVDIRTAQRTDFPQYAITLDWLLQSNGALDASYDLATAITIALSSDRLAQETDELLDFNAIDRRGWWGDLDADTIWNGWPIGSRFWLLSRSKITDSSAKRGATVTQVQNYIRECLDPFISAQIISDYTMNVMRNPINRNRIDAQIVIERGPQPPISLQFQVVWDEMGLSIKLN